ncbi:hypothetical protein [Pseudotamlana carrageenivorans]|uniref:Uncharacterized protein n=1 Tax=Pseudotamlana carrageenivorans TaxID=2069432 RepID=A0A2I7SFS8_9FLAO|nr:hypothetical protein [Tamlana carrageenivorans]AUS04720.1 hypothetical protein C1A40_04175 [Tamlana carrageenivorans]
MQIIKLILSLLALVLTSNTILAQNKTQILTNLNETIIDEKNSFIDNSISKLIDALEYDVKGYALKLTNEQNIKEIKFAYIYLHFLPKEDEVYEALKGTLNSSNNDYLTLIVKIKNTDDFPFTDNKFPNYTAGNNWNSSAEFAVANSGIIVEHLKIISK